MAEKNPYCFRAVSLPKGPGQNGGDRRFVLLSRDHTLLENEKCKIKS